MIRGAGRALKFSVSGKDSSPIEASAHEVTGRRTLDRAGDFA
jgi:hypothetical protein